MKPENLFDLLYVAAILGTFGKVLHIMFSDNIDDISSDVLTENEEGNERR
ncbi:hypothetical protein [Heliophilum fasciatum]|uniref:Uncharacterized protein n=1 Tax=Heliophilum fasciatum TaxID=35700 RepID=A0A4R2RSB7_9FIRM|nr:hypothetical protein [Heliophilum fasciatum]MCW2278912.1 hypothetical protein [Heliophilum fasciatum]TCP62045.1 hypothetical protein EDD73_12418 [Heliophilum fasciatum]